MAIGYFPRLYPDELLSSAVARYRVHTMVPYYAHANKELYGRPQFHTAIAMPRGLKDLHRLIEPFVGLSLEELITRTTLYPYYASLCNKETSTRMLSKMVQRRAGQCGQHRMGGTEPSITRVKLCPNCLTEDVNQFGEAYWHRTHQLSCVHFCDKHSTELLEAIIPTDSRKSVPALTSEIETRHYLPFLSERSRQRLIEIGRLAKEYMEQSIAYDLNISRKAPPKAFRNLYGMGKFLNTASIRKDYINYFGEQCLEILDIPLNQNAHLDYIREIFSRKWTPTKRVAVELFHREFVIPRSSYVRSRDFALEKISNRTWKCQNPAAPHFGQRVVSDVRLIKGFEKNGGIIFRCTCGYQFYIRSSKWNFRSEPVGARVFEFGDLFVETVRNLADQGVRNPDIARRLNTTSRIVKTMLDENYHLRLTRRYGIKEASFASRLKNSLYVAQKRGLIDTTSDAAFTELINNAAKKLLAHSPPKRVTASDLLEMAGISATRLCSAPYCVAAISAVQSLTETASAFRARQANARCR